jgi:hypothetical protein
MRNHVQVFILVISLSQFSCFKKSESEVEESSETEVIDYDSSAFEEEDSYIGDCEVEDGTHSASVDYYNPETGHTASYTLDVDVQDCTVVQINFPNGGWLDSDHISPEELDSNGYCTIYGDDGRTYDIQID